MAGEYMANEALPFLYEMMGSIYCDFGISKKQKKYKIVLFWIYDLKTLRKSIKEELNVVSFV